MNDSLKSSTLKEIKDGIAAIGKEVKEIAEDIYETAFFDSDTRTGYLAAMCEANRKY